MTYTLDNGKVITIPDKDINLYMQKLELSEAEAIDLWLEENDLQENEELEELDQKAKQVKINLGARAEDSENKPRKPKTVKVSDTKKALFSEIFSNLSDVYREKVRIEKENKLIVAEIDGKVFKIDLVEQRPPKNK